VAGIRSTCDQGSLSPDLSAASDRAPTIHPPSAGLVPGDGTVPSGPVIIRTPLGRRLPGPAVRHAEAGGQPGPGLPPGTSGRPAGPSGIAARAQPEGVLDRAPPGPGAWRRADSGPGEPAGRCCDWLSLEKLDPRSNCGTVPTRALGAQRLQGCRAVVNVMLGSVTGTCDAGPAGRAHGCANTRSAP